MFMNLYFLQFLCFSFKYEMKWGISVSSASNHVSGMIMGNQTTVFKKGGQKAQMLYQGFDSYLG